MGSVVFFIIGIHDIIGIDYISHMTSGKLRDAKYNKFLVVEYVYLPSNSILGWTTSDKLCVPPWENGHHTKKIFRFFNFLILDKERCVMFESINKMLRSVPNF